MADLKLKQIDSLISVRDTISFNMEKFSVDAMIPLSKTMLIPGRIVHTNEVLVPLEGGRSEWMTAARALIVINDRIATIESDLIEDKIRREYTHDVFDTSKVESRIAERENPLNGIVEALESVKETSKNTREVEVDGEKFMYIEETEEDETVFSPPVSEKPRAKEIDWDAVMAKIDGVYIEKSEEDSGEGNNSIPSLYSQPTQNNVSAIGGHSETASLPKAKKSVSFGPVQESTIEEVKLPRLPQSRHPVPSSSSQRASNAFTGSILERNVDSNSVAPTKPSPGPGSVPLTLFQRRRLGLPDEDEDEHT